MQQEICVPFCFTGNVTANKTQFSSLSEIFLLCFSQTYTFKTLLCPTQFTNLQVISFGFSIKPSSKLFIFKSNTQYTTPHWAEVPDSAHTPTSIRECLHNTDLLKAWKYKVNKVPKLKTRK